MKIDNPFIDNKYIDEPYINALEHLEEFIIDTVDKIGKNPLKGGPSDAIRAIHVINSFCEENKLKSIPLSGLGVSVSLTTFINALNNKLTDLLLNETKDKYKNIFSKKIYNLSDAEYKSIKNTINSLKEKITNIENIEDDYRDRLLKKLEEIENELHMKMNSFDSIIGKSVDILKVTSCIDESKEGQFIKDDAIILINDLSKIESFHTGLPDFGNIIGNKKVKKIEKVS